MCVIYVDSLSPSHPHHHILVYTFTHHLYIIITHPQIQYTHHGSDKIYLRTVCVCVCVYIRNINTHTYTHKLPSLLAYTSYNYLYIIIHPLIRNTYTYTPQKHELNSGPPNISQYLSPIPQKNPTKQTTDDSLFLNPKNTNSKGNTKGKTRIIIIIIIIYTMAPPFLPFLPLRYHPSYFTSLYHLYLLLTIISLI